MPRRFGEEINELKIHDNISNSDIVLYYRAPTTAERAAYTNELIRRKGRKVEFKQFETRLKYGLKILSGFREGDFEDKIDGRFAPLASDPKSAHYAPDWKDRIQKNAPDIIEVFAAHIFEGPAEVEAETLSESQDETEAEDAEKNSITTSGS